MRLRWFSVAALGASVVAALTLSSADGQPPIVSGPYAVFGYSELGLHWTQSDFSEMSILPLGNTIRAQVILRGPEPEILDGDVTVRYAIPKHSRSWDKTNFWKYAPQLFGASPANDVGLTGHGLMGTMTATASNIWQVTGVPVMPIDDAGKADPYPVGLITVTGAAGTALARPVIGVSTEFNCTLCHGSPGSSAAREILQVHDAFQGTNLADETPVQCSNCHADPAVGAPGLPEVSTLSHAIHQGMASYVEYVGLDNVCFACHPGIRDKTQRDVHKSLGIECIDCHGGMLDVANPDRVPWTTLPRCGDCHNVPGHAYEQPGVLYKDSIGHAGVHCTTCHGPPHAIGTAITAVDNEQAIQMQGHSGTINTCTVCHIVQPSEPFFHKIGD
ncbi:MAG: hypothetical protein U0572_08460 [Phycisphaerales bacterium]